MFFNMTNTLTWNKNKCHRIKFLIFTLLYLNIFFQNIKTDFCSTLNHFSHDERDDVLHAGDALLPDHQKQNGAGREVVILVAGKAIRYNKRNGRTSSNLSRPNQDWFSFHQTTSNGS